jgi:hypothetical protein
MPSVVDICNRALQKLGASRIISLSDDTVSGRACNVAYESVRDRELRRHPWNFAITRESLASEVATPEYGYDYQYPLPSDCIRVLPNDQNEGTYEIAYKIEGRKLLSNSSGPIYLRYISKVSDTTLFDTLFVEVLACAMAMEMCEELTQSNSKRQLAAEEYKALILEARRTNAFEQVPIEPATDTWITSRL